MAQSSQVSKTMKISVLFFLSALLFFAPFVQSEADNFNRKRRFDVQHYVIRVSFDHKRKKVFGDTTIHLKPLSGHFEKLELDAVGLKFSSITLENTSKKLRYKVLPEKVSIALDRPYRPNETISIRLKYTALPKKGVYFVDAKRKGEVKHSAQIWTQGEAEETHHWLPSFDFPDDKATTEKFITVKKGFTVIGNGELLKKIKNRNGTTTFHYKMPVPHSIYLTSFVVGKYKKITDQYRGIPLGFFVYPGKESIVPKAFGKTKDMFRIFEELTGVDYPFNKYDQTMVGRFSASGMENITATTMSDTDILMADFEIGQLFVEDLVAHELAHSWFGNLVTCRNWAELWLNEGFATFMEAAYREKMYGREAYLKKIKSDAVEYFAFASGLETKQHPLFNLLADAKDDDTMFDNITYQKGGAVIHTLRSEIGDQAFWKGMNLYLDRHKFKNVETIDLKTAMEEASGKNLTRFFKQWVYSEGYPKIRIEPSYSAKTKTLKLAVSQIHNADADTPDVFEIPLDVEIDVAGTKTNKRFQMTKRKQQFSVKLDGKPNSIKFDKNLRIPLKIISRAELEVTR